MAKKKLKEKEVPNVNESPYMEKPIEDEMPDFVELHYEKNVTEICVSSFSDLLCQARLESMQNNAAHHDKIQIAKMKRAKITACSDISSVAPKILFSTADMNANRIEIEIRRTNRIEQNLAIELQRQHDVRVAQQSYHHSEQEHERRIKAVTTINDCAETHGNGKYEQRRALVDAGDQRVVDKETSSRLRLYRSRNYYIDEDANVV